ncbi:bone marrow proteoglycan-like [Otolemur garnettii]|uniref:bone marrow proteoglycan-like n=1 Tax=Otolemur garnettii TaxID=30611 RepID=UPI000C7F5E47|nr:bone marrow proteoglycan-like [Otolemur garnettii]
MKLPLLLALLFGAVSALHLRAKTSTLESSLGAETLPQHGEMPEQEAEEAPPGEMASLEGEEEGGCGSEDAPEEETAAESISALDVVDKDVLCQCPKEEDTVKITGIPGCKTCRFILVNAARNFNSAQATCRRCYRGNLVSVHNYNFNSQIQSTLCTYNQGYVWIGGVASRRGACLRMRWVDHSCWNFSYWAWGQPSICNGRCVTMNSGGGRWSLARCHRCLPFVCSY